MLLPFFTLGLSLLLRPACFGARAQTVLHVVQDEGTSVVDAFDFNNGGVAASILSFALLGSADGATVYSELFIEVFTDTPFGGAGDTTTETATFFNIISQSAGGYVEGSFNFPAIDGVGESVSCVYGSDGQDAVCEQFFPAPELEGDGTTTSTLTYTGRVVPFATLFAQETRTTSASQSSTASSSSATPAQTSAGASPTSVVANADSVPTHRTANFGAIVGGIIAGLVVLAGAVFWAWRLRRRRAQRHRFSAQLPPEPFKHDPPEAVTRMRMVGDRQVLSLDQPTAVERGIVESQAEAMRKVSTARRTNRSGSGSSQQDASDTVLAQQMQAMAGRMAMVEAQLSLNQRGEESPPEYRG